MLARYQFNHQWITKCLRTSGNFKASVKWSFFIDCYKGKLEGLEPVAIVFLASTVSDVAHPHGKRGGINLILLEQ
jgi:hypothetical protein